MAFDDLDATGAAQIIASLGEVVTYTPVNGQCCEVCAIVDHDVQPMDPFDGVVGEKRTEVEFLASSVTGIARGDTVTIDGTDYTLQDKIDGDGIITRWSVRLG